MAEQQPHLEILSRNRLNRSPITILVAVVPVTAFTGLIIYALIPFLWLIGYGMIALAAISFLYLVALLYFDIKRRALHAKVVHLGEYGALDAEQWRMLPLALPAPKVTVTPEDPESVKKWEDNIRDAYA